jgi:hypothetical protein
VFSQKLNFWENTPIEYICLAAVLTGEYAMKSYKTLFAAARNAKRPMTSFKNIITANI